MASLRLLHPLKILYFIFLRLRPSKVREDYKAEGEKSNDCKIIAAFYVSFICKMFQLQHRQPKLGI